MARHGHGASGYPLDKPNVQYTAQPFFPALCLASNEFGKEAAHCMLSTARIVLRSPLSATRFLGVSSRFWDGELFRSIHRLELHHVDYFFHAPLPWEWRRLQDRPQNNDYHFDRVAHAQTVSTYMELVGRCEELRELKLSFTASKSLFMVTLPQGVDFLATPVPLEHLVESFYFKAILRCKELRVLTLFSWRIESWPMSSLVELGKWVKERHLEQKGTMRVEVTCPVRDIDTT
jgi:hypothetical protein